MKKKFIILLMGILSFTFLGCGEIKVDGKDETYGVEKNNENLLADTKKDDDSKFFDEVFSEMVSKNYEDAKKYLDKNNIEYTSRDTEGKPTRSVITITNPNNIKEKISSLYMESSKDKFELITYFKEDKIASATYIDGKLKFNIDKETYLDNLDDVKKHLFSE